MAELFSSRWTRNEDPDAQTNIWEAISDNDHVVASRARELEQEGFSGLSHSTIEMLVVIMKDREQWHRFQEAVRDHDGAGFTSMSLMECLPSLLKVHFRSAVQNGYNLYHVDEGVLSKQVGRDDGLKSFGYEEADDITEDTASDSDDSWSVDDECSTEFGEFIMGGRPGQGILPISYKNIDLLQHPRAEIAPSLQACVKFA